ncbi:MAG: DUF5688 family protein [Lachnospiraceae bacterium]
MEFDQFKNALREKLEGTLEGDLSFQETKDEAQKEMILCRLAGLQTGIPLYVEEFYQEYLKGAPFGQIFSDIVSNLKEAQIPTLLKSEWDNIMVPENIVPALVPQKGNERMLEERPYLPFEDLAVIFKGRISEDTLVNVMNADMQKLGFDENQLFDLAVNNPAYRDNIVIMGMGEMLQGIMAGENTHPMGTEIASPNETMIVIGNQMNFYGAASILDSDTMQKVTELFGEDVYILPSSIHECIAVPKSSADVEGLREMVRDINQTQVVAEERLSDEVYQYDALTRRVSLAQDSRSMEIKGLDKQGPGRQSH